MKRFIIIDENGTEIKRLRTAIMAHAYVENHPGCTIRIAAQEPRVH